MTNERSKPRLTLRPSTRSAVGVGALLGAILGCSSEENAPRNAGASGSVGTGGVNGGTGPSGAGAGGNRGGAGGAQPVGGTSASGGTTTSNGGKASGGAAAAAGRDGATGGRPQAAGGAATGGETSSAGQSAGGSAAGGTSAGGAAGSASGGRNGAGGAAGSPASGGAAGGSGTTSYPCDGTTTGYDAVAVKSGSTWTVTNGSREVYSGPDMQQALTAAYASLSAGRTTKQSILVQGSGDIPATVQLSVPSYTILNVCGTINVSGTPSGSDRSPIYARNARDIEIPNLKMTGSPQYGLFFRQTNDVHLGRIDLRLSASAGIGIRVDSGGNAQSTTDFNENLKIDYVYGSGMARHIVETYGIRNIEIGTVEGNDVGECGLLLNRSTHAEIGLVTCTGCATGTGYAAFRVANSVGKVGNEFPPGNIHVGKVYARGGGRGIFSVSGSGGLTIDEIDIADTGNGPILLQNTYNTTIAAKSGSVSGGLVQISNDTEDTNDNRYPPSQNIELKNLTLSNGASVRQDWCSQFGRNGCSATDVTGGTVSMCP